MSAALQTARLQRPRPWRIVGDSVVEDANGQEVCTVDTQRNLDDDVALALAQLIAGAPVLEAGATLRHLDGRTGAFISVEDDGRYRVQSLKGAGFWIFHPDDCDRISADRAPAAPQAGGVEQDERLKIGAAIASFHMLDILTDSDPIVAASAANALADRVLAFRAVEPAAWRIERTKHAVKFWIGNQGFTVATKGEDDEAQHLPFMEEMLRRALTRISASPSSDKLQIDREAIIEECALAAEAQDKTGHEWVKDSLWETILRRAGANVRALKTEAQP